MIAAAPVDRPEVRNSGPRMELFHNGRALNADSKIPV